jgi:hypothetical protein
VVGRGYLGGASEPMTIEVEVPRIRLYLSAPNGIIPLLMKYRGKHKENKVDEHYRQVMSADKLRLNPKEGNSRLMVHIHENAIRSFTDVQELPLIKSATKCH